MTRCKFKLFWKTAALVSIVHSIPTISWAQSVNDSIEACHKSAGPYYDYVKVKNSNICVVNLAEDYDERIYPTISEKKCAEKYGVNRPIDTTHLCLYLPEKKKNGYEAPIEDDLLILFFKSSKSNDDEAFHQRTKEVLFETVYRQRTLDKRDPHRYSDNRATRFTDAIIPPYGNLVVFAESLSDPYKTNFKVLGCLNEGFSNEEIKSTLDLFSKVDPDSGASYINKMPKSVRCPLEVYSNYADEHPDYKEKVLALVFDDYKNTYLSGAIADVNKAEEQKQRKIANDKVAYQANPFVHEAVKNGDASKLKSLIDVPLAL